MNHEIEKSLEAITRAIVNIREREILLKVIIEEVQPLFDFDDVGLFIIHEEENYYIDLAAEMPAISPSEVNYPLYEQKIRKTPYRGSLIDWMVGKIEQVHLPLSFDLQDLAKRFPEYPQSKTIIQMGFRDCLATTLRTQRKLIGVFCINSRQKDFFKSKQSTLFQKIANQVALAADNIRAYERLNSEKQFKENLLTISETIASIQNRSELLKAIYQKIALIFPFDTYGLFVLHSTGKYHYEIVDSEIMNKDPIQVKIEHHLGGVSQLFWHEGSAVELIMREGPGIFAIKDLVHPHVKYMLEGGLQHLIGGPLRHAGKDFGMICFNSKQANFYNQAHFPFFKAIAEQISVVVDNVLNNEAVQQSEREKAILLQVSEALAKSKTRQELLQTTVDHIKSLFVFEDIALLEIKPDGSHRDFVIDEQLYEFGGSGGIREAGIKGFMPYHASFEVTLKQTQIIDFTWLRDRYPDHYHFPYLAEAGMKEILSSPLFHKGQVIGLLCLWSKKKGFFHEEQLPLFQQLANCVATTMANVLANEDILQEKRYKEELLHISEAIAAIRNKQHLSEVIYQKIKPVISFDTFGLIIPDKTNKYHIDLAVEEGLSQAQIDQQLRANQKGKTPKHPVIDYFIEKGPLFMSLEMMMEMFPGHAHYPAMQKGGYQQIIGGPLRTGGNTIGMLCFSTCTEHTYSEQDLPFFQAIAEQMAVALSNILANEEIQEREREKSVLLHISEILAEMRTRKELLQVIFETIRKVLPFSDVWLFQVRTDGYYRDFAVDEALEKEASSKKIGESSLAGYLPPHASIQAFMDQVKIYSLEDLMAEYPGHPYYEFLDTTGQKKVMGGPLNFNGQRIGILCFWAEEIDFFQEEQLSLFRQILNLISTATANIIANEDILAREQEEALKVKLIDVISTRDTWPRRLEALTHLLESHFPFHFISFGMVNEPHLGAKGPNYGLERIGSEEYRVIDLSRFLKISGLTEREVMTDLNREPYTRHLLWQEESFKANIQASPVKTAIHRVFGVNSLLLFPVSLAQGRVMYVQFYHREAKVYDSSHIDLFRKIQSSLVLAIEKQLYHEEIVRLNSQLEQEKDYLTEEVVSQYNSGEIVGDSPAIRLVFEKIERVASTDTTVLITGETGTGKELIARAIHQSSNRKEQAFIKLNCAALPAELVESELFGHVQGAFTGAVKDRMGKFELAHQGTIFLDEVGELPEALQAKLLRVIQEREIERLGSNQVKKIDVRIIAATNRVLEEEIEQGNFRPDLYFRLNIFPIQVPPLSQRKEDISQLAQHFLRIKSRKAKKKIKKISEAFMEELLHYHWPGNVRELEHIIERAVLLSDDTTLDYEFPLDKTQKSTRSLTASPREFTPKTIKEAEIELIMNTLKLTGGKVSGAGGAAELLGLNSNTLESRLKKYGIVKKYIIKG